MSNTEGMMKLQQAFCITILLLPTLIEASELHDAAAKGDLEKVKAFLKSNPQGVNELDKQRGTTALLELLIADDYESGDPKRSENRINRVAVLKTLLEHKADPNIAESRRGGTALHCVAHTGFKEAAALLLEHGAKLDAQDKRGCSPIFEAVDCGNVEMLRFLIEKKADLTIINLAVGNILHLAALRKSPEVIDILIDAKMDINARAGAKKWTPLHLAARGEADGSVIIDRLLKRGADPKLQDADGKTPAAYAEAAGRQTQAVTIALARHGKHEVVGKWCTKMDTDELLKTILADRPIAAAKMTKEDKDKIREALVSLGKCECHEFHADKSYTFEIKIPKPLLQSLLELADGCEDEQRKKEMRAELDGFAEAPPNAKGTWDIVDGRVITRLENAPRDSKLIVKNDELTFDWFMNRVDFYIAPKQ